ncbi:unnamed protein product [Darwinula stevensoni]|uniref:Mos1 transposase HTH domain-containing protein n=1 Tax=Darwinula stevensoni TaxID=69355 RepID=A0A7R9AB08_9CRUS|nr:unnamed protein product [Darwinula stevensoni]CAG0898732.1 unnamed protein product [Darwinula stevensoni]
MNRSCASSLLVPPVVRERLKVVGIEPEAALPGKRRAQGFPVQYAFFLTAVVCFFRPRLSRLAASAISWQPWLRSNEQLFAPLLRAPLPHPTTIVYYEFLQGHAARAAADNICAAFKGNVVHYSTVFRWFKRLESGDTTFGDRPRSGRPSTVDDEAMRNALDAKPNATTRESVTTLGVTHVAIGNHLNDLGYRKKNQTSHRRRPAARVKKNFAAEMYAEVGVALLEGRGIVQERLRTVEHRQHHL